MGEIGKNCNYRVFLTKCTFIYEVAWCMALKSTWVKSLALPLISQVGFRLLVIYLVPALFFFIIKYKIGVYIMPTA